MVELQGGDQGTLQLWQELVELSQDYLHRIYGQLGVTLDRRGHPRRELL